MRAFGLVLVLLFCACDPSPAAATSPRMAVEIGQPLAEPGMVLRVDELALSAAEVDVLASDIGVLFPEYTTAHRRRLALTNEILPRLATRAADPQGCAAARARAAAADLAQVAWRDQSNYSGLGLALWSAARHLTPGTWSEPLELTGRWVRVLLEEIEPRPDPRAEILHVAVLTFPYLEPANAKATVEQAIDHARLTILDPAWNDVVPEDWKHRMRGSKP